MKELWFWLSKELAELFLVFIGFLIALLFYGTGYLVHRHKVKKRYKERHRGKGNGSSKKL